MFDCGIVDLFPCVKSTEVGFKLNIVTHQVHIALNHMKNEIQTYS